MEMEIESKAYKFNEKNYTFECWYLKEPSGEALIRITKDDKVVREFLFPSYKIYNITAHADDIIKGLENESDEGLRIAGSDGLFGNAYQGE
jgi:hypothetical protein